MRAILNEKDVLETDFELNSSYFKFIFLVALLISLLKVALLFSKRVMVYKRLPSIANTNNNI